MAADLIFASIFLLLVFFGWRSGMMRQALRVGAAIAVVLGTPFVSRVLCLVLFKEDSVAAPVLEVASMILAAVLIYIVVSLAGWLIIKGLHKLSDTLSSADKLGGAAIGGFKAALIVYILGSFLVMLHGPLHASDPEDRFHLRDGAVTSFVQDHNLIAPWRFPQLGQLNAALRVADHVKRSARGAQALRSHADVADFLRREDFKKLAAKDKLVGFAKEDNYAMSMADEDVRLFLKDTQAAEALGKIAWPALEKELGIGPINAPAASQEKGDGAVKPAPTSVKAVK